MIDPQWTRGATDVVRVETAPAYSVALGPGLLTRLPAAVEALAPSRVAVLTDANLERHYGARLDELLPDAPRHVVAAGEDAKRFQVLEGVLDFLVAQDLDRGACLVAFGGGVVGDLGGLAASLFMRGIRCLQCPTTLLAMVDSSVGGKTAVNLAGGKNLAGTFHQPAAVLADTELLATLPPEEVAAGLGEVLKTALVGDAELLDALATEGAPADPERRAELAARCVRVKAAVVAEDEREGGRRKVLNLGHTFGHALELVAGFGTIPHGVAVAVGLTLAARAAEEQGLLTDPSLPTTVDRCLERLGLPPSIAALRTSTGLPLEPDRLVAALRHDKKGTAGDPAFVLPRAASELLVDQPLPPDLQLALFR